MARRRVAPSTPGSERSYSTSRPARAKLRVMSETVGRAPARRTLTRRSSSRSSCVRRSGLWRPPQSCLPFSSEAFSSSPRCRVCRYSIAQPTNLASRRVAWSALALSLLCCTALAMQRFARKLGSRRSRQLRQYPDAAAWPSALSVTGIVAREARLGRATLIGYRRRAHHQHRRALQRDSRGPPVCTGARWPGSR